MKDFTQFKPESFKYSGHWIDNWFSNFTPCYILFDGILYVSVENFYQAMKTNDVIKRKEIAKLTPSASKKAGKAVNLRTDWEDVKDYVMMTGLMLKFQQYENKKKLLKTGSETLIEWNNWGDRYWGVDISDCKGNNKLGELLMIVRTMLFNHEQLKLDL